MKLCFVFGKGIDGCGVSRGALLFEKWLRESGHETIIINFDNNQGMLRAKNFKFIGEVHNVLKNETEVSNHIISLVNSCDMAIFHSYPTKKQPNYIERFRKFIEKVNGPINVMYDHGVSQVTINLVPQSGELFSYADVLVPQSLEGLSASSFSKFDPGLTGRVIENPVWIDSNSLKKFNKKYEERNKNFVYIGRNSVIKDPSLPCRTESFFPKDWKLFLIGCERSISMFGPKDVERPEGYLSRYVSDYRDRLYYYVANKNSSCTEDEYTLTNWGITQEGRGRIYVYNQYKHDWGMERLGQSMASWCGYKLINNKDYGSRMEYTMLESFLLTLPVIHSKFALNAYSPEGKLWKDYWGPLVFYPEGEKELTKKIVSVCENKREWEDRSMACKEIVEKFNHIETLAPKFLNTVLKLGKRDNKSDPLDLMSSWFPEARHASVLWLW